MAHYAHPPARRRGLHPAVIVLIVIAVMIGVGVAGCAALTVIGVKAADTQANAPKKTYPMHTPAKDGQFTFTVTGVRRTEHIGDEFTGTDAQGEFVVVTMTVLNHGRKAQMLNATDQKLIANGKVYSADSGAFTDTAAFLNNINPGNQVTAHIAFDVPKGTNVNQVVLHDSPYSAGVRVALG